MGDYSFYWYTGVELNPLQLKVSHFKKVWKVLKQKWNIDEFSLGPEIEMMYQNKGFYIGIAKF